MPRKEPTNVSSPWLPTATLLPKTPPTTPFQRCVHVTLPCASSLLSDVSMPICATSPVFPSAVSKVAVAGSDVTNA